MNDVFPIPPERLLEETKWLQALARRLAGPDDADDLAQGTWLRALEQRPNQIRRLRPWLRTVLGHAFQRDRGEHDARLRRETAAARPEATPSTADLAARASLHRAVVDAVLSLDEPGRSTVLLRFFDDRKPEEIARLQDVAVATVHTRLRRAMAVLRARLDREQGGREAWTALAAPALFNGGVPPASGALTAASIGAAKSLLTGVLIMSVPAKVSIGAACALLLAIGIIITVSKAPADSQTASGDPLEVRPDEEAAASSPPGRTRTEKIASVPAAADSEQNTTEGALPSAGREGWALLIKLAGARLPAEPALVSFNKTMPRGTQLYPPTHRRLVTTKDNQILLDGLKDPTIDVRLRLSNRCPVFLKAVRVEGSSRADPVTRTVVVEDGSTVFGDVIRADGVTLPAGTEVVAWAADEPYYMQAFRGDVGELPPDEDKSVLAQRQAIATGPESSQFEIAGLLPGEYQIAVFSGARPPDALTRSVRFSVRDGERTGPLRLVIEKRPEIRLRVVMGEAPLPVYVTLQPIEGPATDHSWRNKTRLVSGDGPVTISGVFPGVYHLKVVEGGAADRLCPGGWRPSGGFNVLNELFAIAVGDRETVRVSKADIDLGEVSLLQGLRSHREWLREVGAERARQIADGLEVFTPAALREAGIDEKWLQHLIIEVTLSRSLQAMQAPEDLMKQDPRYREIVRAWKERDLESYFTNFSKAARARCPELQHKVDKK